VVIIIKTQYLAQVASIFAVRLFKLLSVNICRHGEGSDMSKYEVL
jgi:hypothetical protein